MRKATSSVVLAANVIAQAASLAVTVCKTIKHSCETETITKSNEEDEKEPLIKQLKVQHNNRYSTVLEHQTSCCTGCI